MVLVALFQSTKNGDGTQLVGLVYHHRLETTLQRFVFLKIFLILIECRGTDSPQFATGQRRLQDVGSIHGALTSAGTYQRVNLIDEQDDAAFALGHFLDDSLQSFFKLSFILGTGNKRSHVEREQLFVLQVFGHVAPHNALGQSLHDGRLSCSRLTYQDRIVFRTAAQYLQQPPNLIVAADDRIEFSGTCLGHQILSILVECLIILVATLRTHVLSLAQLTDSSQHVLLVHACIFHDAARRGIDIQQRQQHRLDAHKLIAHLLGHVLGFHQHVVGIAREIRLSALHPWQVLYLALHQLFYMSGIHSQFLEDEGHHVFAFLHDTFQQMHRLDALLACPLGGIDSLLHGFLCLDCKFV